MSESKLQTRILQWLKANGYWVFKTITSNRKGIMDIVGCTPTGRFFGIEVKYGDNKPSKLQAWNVMEVVKRGGIAFVAWDLQEVKDHFAKESVNQLQGSNYYEDSRTL